MSYFFSRLRPASEADSVLVDIHAFLGWFDCSFDACHKPVKFSTGPHAKYTHWKVGHCTPWDFFIRLTGKNQQTVFYTQEPLTVNVRYGTLSDLGWRS